MPTLRAELESLLHHTVEPVELDMALRRERGAEILARSRPPVESTSPEEWCLRVVDHR